VLAVDRLVSDEPAPPGFAAYAVVTGLGSIGLAFANRRRARLGPWAWTIMLAWAGHLWAIVWLLNIELLPLVSLSDGRRRRPRRALPRRRDAGDRAAAPALHRAD